MVDPDLLHRELARLAADTSDSFDLNEGLHQLSVTAAAALGIDGAGVTVHMASGETEYISATDATTLRVEQQQDALKEGACVDAINTSHVVAVDDLSAESRWPRSTSRATSSAASSTSPAVSPPARKPKGTGSAS